MTMNYAPSFDVAAGPIIAIIAMVVGVALGLVIGILLIESIALLLIKWGSFGRGFLAVFAGNIVSTFFGYLLVRLKFEAAGWSFYFFSLITSIVIEGIVLMFFKRGAVRENLIASTVMNLASYLLIVLPVYLFMNLL